MQENERPSPLIQIQGPPPVAADSAASSTQHLTSYRLPLLSADGTAAGPPSVLSGPSGRSHARADFVHQESSSSDSDEPEPRRPSTPSSRLQPKLPMSPSVGSKNPLLQYNMNHARRGDAIILNQVNFESQTHLSERLGSDVDAARLQRTFERLGFTVESRRNQTVQEVFSLLREFRAKDHSDADCFALAVMSHGDRNVLHCTNGALGVESLTRPFRADNCASLVGKPKLFFFQACRGSEGDRGAVVQIRGKSTSAAVDDSEEKQMKLPIEADNFFMYSTPPGYISWRSELHGSWFVQELCRALDQWGDQHEFVQLMVTVQREVACKYEAEDKNAGFKQMPVSVSQLTRLLCFLPKVTGGHLRSPRN